MNPKPKLLKKRRIVAFRVPETYVFDAVRGYQGADKVYNAFRIKVGTIPKDAKLVWVKFDHTKHDAYFCIEHPSFPEYTPGTFCQELPIDLEEYPVQRLDKKKKK